MSMQPVVRYMILCEDARPRKGTRGKMDIFGVLHTVHASTFPFGLSFSVYLCLVGGRGRGLGQIVVVNDDTDEIIYGGSQLSFDFGIDPIKIFASTIRIPHCVLPAPGLYRVEFVYNEMVLRRCPLLVREQP